MLKGLKPATIGIHGRRDKAYNAATFPIYLTSTFGFEHSEDIPAIIDGEIPDAYIYSRLGNPTVRNVEERLAMLEHAEYALLFNSGMAAVTAAVMANLEEGDLVAASRPIYGGSYHLFKEVLPRFGVKTIFLEAEQLYQLKNHAPEAKIVFFETPANPTCLVLDIQAIVAAAQEVGAMTIVDNTLASPINQNPLDWGVDIVLHSATKYLAGHSDVIAGAVMSSTENIAAIKELRMVFGGSMSPLTAFLLDRSLKTLKVRVDAHNRNAQAIAEFFASDKRVKNVYFPGLKGNVDYAIAKRQMRGFGGTMAIDLADAEAAMTFTDSLHLAFNAVSLGGVESLVTIPALSTHLHVDEEEKRIARVTPSTVRISIGIEDISDLLADFEQALAKIKIKV
jgi:cystathionine beta-lyase/cystathionine gamma-synthase